jgi:hypothetical protein
MASSLPMGAIFLGISWADNRPAGQHIHRGKLLRVKLTEHHVEIFLELQRLAIHPRSRHRDGRRIKIDAHFPPASQAYYEATPHRSCRLDGSVT